LDYSGLVLPDSDLEQCLVSDEKAGKRTGIMGHENQELFTAKDAEDAEENQGLPLMNTDDTARSELLRMDADDRGLNNGTKEIE
jgi:hypothetical protein